MGGVGGGGYRSLRAIRLTATAIARSLLVVNQLLANRDGRDGSHVRFLKPGQGCCKRLLVTAMARSLLVVNQLLVNSDGRGGSHVRFLEPGQACCDQRAVQLTAGDAEGVV